MLELDQNTKKVKARRANELDGKTWGRYSISIWSDIRKNKEELQLKHPAMFPSALAARLIQIFTNAKGKMILDPFAGVGSTLIAAKLSGKDSIGIEISEKYCKIAERRLEALNLFEIDNCKSHVLRANALDILKFVSEDTVDLVITSPPYWDILSQKRTADYKETRDYGDNKGDLGKIASYEDFLLALKTIFEGVHKTMKKGGYCCVNVMDIRKKNMFYPFHMDIANFMKEIGFIFDDIIIWDRRNEYNNMRPLGYPSVFRINKAHEYILIFLKPKH